MSNACPHPVGLYDRHARGLVGALSKYGNRKTFAFGVLFDSQKEAERYIALRALQDSGEISNLETQVPYKLVVNGELICKYVADFVYHTGTGIAVEDVKGYRTREYKLKKKLMRACYGVEIQEV